MSVAGIPLSEAHGWDRSLLGVLQGLFFFGFAVTQARGQSLPWTHKPPHCTTRPRMRAHEIQEWLCISPAPALPPQPRLQIPGGLWAARYRGARLLPLGVLIWSLVRRQSCAYNLFFIIHCN